MTSKSTDSRDSDSVARSSDGGSERGGDARAALLSRVMAEAGAHGLADRSLRELAEAAGTSHRMLLYHFGSRPGLVSAIVEAVESSQRELLLAMAGEATSPADLVMRLWRQVSSEELRPFVRLFFECVATAGEELTDQWLEVSETVTESLGVPFDADEIRLGVAVSRGLLIDVLASGDAGPATRSMELFLEMRPAWQEPRR
jgi:AcrR family transcriptional regulator